MDSVANAVHREPWSKGKIVGQKAPFKLKDIWALRVRLQMENRVRELALVMATRWHLALWSCSTRPSARCGSRSRRQPETLCRSGSLRLD
jgi:hypothetical protein